MGASYQASVGELRHGRHVVARLARCWKQDHKVTFITTYVNRFAEGLGPPTHLVLQVTPKAVCVYPVVSGSAADGAVKVDGAQVRTETRTL